MRTDKIFKYYKVKAGRDIADDGSSAVKTASTIVLKAIDFACPVGGLVAVILNGEIISASHTDKSVVLPPGISIEGPNSIVIRLDNSKNLNEGLLGATIYYEEL